MYGIESCAEPLYQLILTKDGFNKNSLIYINIMKLGEIMGFFFSYSIEVGIVQKIFSRLLVGQNFFSRLISRLF